MWYRSDTELAISDLMQSKKNLNKQKVGNSRAWTEGSSAQSSALDAEQLPAPGLCVPQFKFRWERLAVPGWVGSSLLLRPQRVTFGMYRIIRVSFVCWLDDWWLGSLDRVRVRAGSPERPRQDERVGIFTSAPFPRPRPPRLRKRRGARRWVNDQGPVI